MVTKEELKQGFAAIDADETLKIRAIEFLETWLRNPEYRDYQPQLNWMIQANRWGDLLDSFYQVLPFGTGGRRGAVGIGPNRMNLWTLGASVQGHCEYLKARFPASSRPLQVVIAYDVRQFEDKRKIYEPNLPNPILHLSSRAFAEYAAGVYAANGVISWILPRESSRFLATPELSFAIRFLQAHGGLNISASHNPPDDNGGKFYDENGAQPVPPEDQLMSEWVDQVKDIHYIPYLEAKKQGKLQFLDERAHHAYIELCKKQGLSNPPLKDEFRLVYTPLHGVGSMTAFEALIARGFQPIPVAEQMNPDGQFTNVTKSPSTEVQECFDRAIAVGKEKKAHLLMATDPDADRIGGMASTQLSGGGDFRFLTGNEIAILLTHYKLAKMSQEKYLPSSPIIVRTEVTSSMISRLAHHYQVQIVENLLVGFKYIADVVYHLEKTGSFQEVSGTPDDFILGCEESHGIMTTAALRDKDAGGAAVLLADMALDQLRKQRTVIDYLESLFQQFGYFRNEVINIVMPGIEGKSNMARMLDSLRKNPPQEIAGIPVTSFTDLRSEDSYLGPIKGATDFAARNFLIFHLGEHGKIVLRPSGTEPKAKAYIECCSEPRGEGVSAEKWREIQTAIDARTQKLATGFLTLCLGTVGLTPTPGADRLSR